VRRLSEIFGDKSPSETKKSKDKYKSGTYKEESYKSEDRDEGSDLARGFKNIEAEKYDEDLLSSEEFLEYGVTYVKPIKLRSLTDVQKVSKELNDGNIVLGDITPLLNRDPAELKRAIDQIKGICRGIGGDIIGIGESKVLITPTNIKVFRQRE